MDEKLEFSLPEKKNGPGGSKWTVILLLLLLIASIAIIVIWTSASKGPNNLRSSALTAEQTKQLASRLAARDLHEPAVRVWQDYLTQAEISETQRAGILFQIGTLLEKADRNAEAIEYYYRCEMTAEPGELQAEINTRIKGCFEKLGRFSALRYEMMDRTSLTGAAEAGSDIIAEIGPQKITQAQLDAIIESQIDNQLSQFASFMDPEQLNEQKKRMLTQYQEPQAKSQALQAWIAQEVLYRKALENELARKDEVKRVLDDLMRNVLSQQLMNDELASKINITETDLKTWYEARKNDYVEPAKARIRHILVASDTEAADLIKRIKAGEDFAALAGEFSKDETTSAAGGLIDADIVKDAHMPGIGSSQELGEMIFAARAGDLLPEPVKTEKGWEIVKVESITEPRQKSFEEVGRQIMTELTNQKRQDVQQEFIKKLMDEYNVIIHRATMPQSEPQE